MDLSQTEFNLFINNFLPGIYVLVKSKHLHKDILKYIYYLC